MLATQQESLVLQILAVRASSALHDSEEITDVSSSQCFVLFGKLSSSYM